MSCRKIFITGITGFIGSHLAELLLSEKYEVMALKRERSDLWRCSEFADRILWVTEESMETSVANFRPDVILHLGWSGINVADRSNWEVQMSNLPTFLNLLRIAKETSVKKFLAFGSQAEYGPAEGRVSEAFQPNPDNAYAVMKLTAQKMLEVFCKQHDIEWYWLRIYSVYGPKEDKNWFVPMVITNLLNGLPCHLTKCEQQYDYLYVKDLAGMILEVVRTDADFSGVYNISSNQSKSLKSLIIQINEIIRSESVISFGSVPYRQNQSMHIEGNSERFNTTFGEYSFTDIKSALTETINFYRSSN
jgi:nucleoside-diphosphate-sugar epimerase